MTDHNRNMRTLIVCFVLLVMALLPLRLVEYGEKLSSVSGSQVLGESIKTEVVLPNDSLSAGQINYGEEIKESDLLR